ncbi:acyl carrier protein, partial [Acinetobacter baumannii]
KLEQLLIDTFAAKPEQLTDEFSILNLPEWDSMTHMIFITKFESEFEVELTGYEIASLATIGDLRKILTLKGK